MSLPSPIISFLEKNPITLADAGARGGINNFQHLAAWMHVHAFEADNEEAEQLDAQKNRFKSHTVHQLAISSKTGKRNFHLTKKRSFSSFLEFDREEFRKYFGRVKDAALWESFFEIEKSVEVDCSSADSAFSNTILDFLKLDTQGTELEILEGAKSLLQEKRISIIETEVNMQPVYKGQPEFSVIDRFLKEKGFLLVDYRINQHAFSSFHTNKNQIENPRPGNGGDAVYVLDMNLLPEEERNDRAMKAALLLAHKGYLSIAEYLLKTFTKTSGEETREIFSALNQLTGKEKRKNFWRKWLPPVFISSVK